MRFVIVTGLSGAGKSQTIKVLEDIGYFCIDNMPPILISKFLEMCHLSENKIDKVALIIDTRGGKLFNHLFRSLSQIENEGYEFEILFLEANDEVLVKRFKETRRNHPLSPEGRIIDGITKEREILNKLRERANYIIDTSNLATRQLREELLNIFVEGKTFKGLIISVNSFGFKYGVPTDTDLVFDVRFLPNPFYVESLKKLTGKNEKIKEYVLKFDEANEFLTKICDLLDFLIPNYIKEGKSQLVISVGCTGGKHRSVVMAEEIYRYLANKENRVIIDHRDVQKK